jgi:beta-glucosidase
VTDRSHASQTDDAPGTRPHFPREFVWGAATSAFQIEGATKADGRGASIWDTFCATPGAIADGSDGSRACESHARWAEDLDLVRSLGFGAYRFSIAWPRVMPAGTGRVSAAGLDHYERLVDGMLARSLVPYATLYHWDLPQVLEDRGGWRSRDTAFAFADYAAAVVERLGDRVASYATLNEPWCSAFLGYGTGEHAPGQRDVEAVQRAVHHLLLAHGLACGPPPHGPSMGSSSTSRPPIHAGRVTLATARPPGATTSPTTRSSSGRSSTALTRPRCARTPWAPATRLRTATWS